MSRKQTRISQSCLKTFQRCETQVRGVNGSMTDSKSVGPSSNLGAPATKVVIGMKACWKAASFGARRLWVRLPPSRLVYQGVAQSGSRALGLEPRGRRFESCLPDLPNGCGHTCGLTIRHSAPCWHGASGNTALL